MKVVVGKSKEFSNERMKVQVKRSIKSFFFCHQKSRETLHEIFFSLQYPQCLYNHFPPIPPIFCCPLFSENYLNSEVRINKMVNKHTFDYHPSPSQLTLRIYPLIFLWTPKGFISPESFLNFFLNLYIPPWLRKSFKFIVLRLLANTFVSQKIESAHFYSCSQAKLPPGFFHYPQWQKEITHFPRTAFSEDLFFPQEEDHGVEKITKIKPTRVLVTSFDKFHHLCNLYIFLFLFCCAII